MSTMSTRPWRASASAYRWTASAMAVPVRQVVELVEMVFMGTPGSVEIAGVRGEELVTDGSQGVQRSQPAAWPIQRARPCGSSADR